MITDRVGWDRDPVVRGWPGLPPLPGDLRVPACVVGLGASGLAAVADLSARGVGVVGVDAGRVGAGAAGRNGGFLLAGGARSLPSAISTWGRQAATGLYQETADELERTASLLGGVVRRCGSIRVAGLPGPDSDEREAADRAREVVDCAAEADALRDLGVPVERYAGPLGTGLFLPRDAAVNPARRVVELAGRITAPLYEHTRVLSVSPGLVATPHGEIAADLIVVAVDGGLDALLPATVTVVRTARLQMLATAPTPVRLPGPVYARWGYDYAQQLPEGAMFVGGCRDRHAEAEWTSQTVPTAAVQRDIEAVATRFAGDPVTVTDRWAASAGYTADGRAACGAVAPGVVACGGYSGTGNLVGVIAARAAVAYGIDGTPVPAWFRSPTGD